MCSSDAPQVAQTRWHGLVQTVSQKHTDMQLICCQVPRIVDLGNIFASISGNALVQGECPESYYHTPLEVHISPR